MTMVLQNVPLNLSLSDALQILVSLLIAGLYYLTLQNQRRQSAIQEQQNQIMKWQTRLMAAEYEPDIRVEDFTADGNTAHITLANLGRGRATNMNVKCLMYYRHNGNYSTAFSNQVLGSVVKPKELPLSRLGQKESFIGGEQAINTKTENDSLKNSIRPQETDLVFIADVELSIEALDPVMDVSFTRAVEHMQEKWDADEVGFDLYLFYEDVVDQQFPVRVKSVKDIETEEGLTVSDALERGEEIDSAVSTLVPDAGKPEGVQSLEVET